ncbi:unnamed protein product [Lactuca virosa]|uniref:Uncharacterized protein n=1 Tax=Lactuca virosa TaxID=75947 RepID=A0AAU9PPY2_9ASTR|nr:unnamed protein product [Lactuca virosa]
MAETGSPQFLAACSATTSASGVICLLSTSLQLHTFLMPLSNTRSITDFRSDYKCSVLVIFIIQFIGVILGTIAPCSRSFSTLSFNFSGKWIWNHIKVTKVESYWTEKLCDWKRHCILFPSISRKGKIILQNLYILILHICIAFQKTVVVACKMIVVIPIFLVICVLCCSGCWKCVKVMFSGPCIVLLQKPKPLGNDKDSSRYVLQLQDEMEFAERKLKGITESVNHLIQKAEKQTPNNLTKLLGQSRGFQGVEKFDIDRFPSLLSEEHLNCWSLPLVTLTAIAMSLPNIQNDIVDSLVSGVSEGLVYVTLVEESLNATDDLVMIQSAAKTLMLEVEVYHKWLGNRLHKPTPQGNTTRQSLQWLNDTAKTIVTEVEDTDIGGRNDNSKCRCICANSMYRITETILLSYTENIDQASQKELFEELSSMVADILAACLTNLPQVIEMKCHTSAIEKREANVAMSMPQPNFSVRLHR